MEAVPYCRFFLGNLKEIILNLFNKRKVTLKQRLHFLISLKEHTWWENNFITATKSLKKPPIDATIYTGVSLDD